MGEIKLKPGWFMRDVNKAAEQRKCYRMLRSLDTDELRQWHAQGAALIKARPKQEVSET